MESLCICYKRQKLGLLGCVQAGSGRFLLRLDRGTICRAELGVCGSDQLGSKSRLDPLPFTNFRGSSLLTPGFILQSGLLEVPAIGLMLGVKNELKYGAKMKVSNGARSRLLQSLPLLMVFIIGNERFPPPQPSEPSPPDKRCRQE